MRPRFALARRRAAELLHRFPQSAPPVSLERISEALGVLVIEEEPADPNLFGLCYHDDGRSVIALNPRQHRNRLRFSWAHELGHLLLHGSDVHVDDAHVIGFRDQLSSKGIAPREVEANAFAAALLMPETMLRRDLQRSGINLLDDDAIHAFAERYEVSVQAMAIRLSRLT